MVTNIFSLIFSFFFVGIVQSSGEVPAPINTQLPAQTSSQSSEVVTSTSLSSKSVDQLAKCLTQKGAIMYGAYWCPHCASQKELFGDSMQYLKYQECDAKGENGQPEVCQKADIQSYPTWKIPGKEPLIGEQTLGNLAQTTNCPL